MKRIISWIAVILFLLSSFTLVSANEGKGTFEDVTAEHYAFDAVEYFYSRNVIQGVGDNKYDPDGFITREQFAKMISIIYSKEDYLPTGQSFSDVTSDMWSYKYIESVKEYLTGYYPDGGEAFFNPYGKATREDIAYALVKIGGLQTDTDLSVLDKYTDKEQISVSLREYIAAAVNSGLMQGYDNQLRPQDGCTRAEVAELLFRAIKKPASASDETHSGDEEANDAVKSNENNPNGDIQAKDDNPGTEDNTKVNAEENVIFAGNIIEFKIINTGEENIDIYDEDRLAGEVKMIFGEDGIKDTKLVANITVDGTDEYLIESTAIDRYSPMNNAVLLELNYDVYKNGALIIENGGYRAYVNKEDNEMVLNGRVHFWAEDITWLLGKLPKEPDEQPYELWADSSVISYWVMENDTDTGYLNYTYKIEKGISKFESKFTLNENTYSVELVKELSKNGDVLSGQFNVICNGEIVAENADGKITGYNGKVGGSARLELDDGSFGIDLKIIEISY